MPGRTGKEKIVNLKNELKTVEKKLRDHQEELEYKVVKAFISYVMEEDSIGHESYERFEGQIENLRLEYIRVIATLQAVCTILDWKEEE